MTAPAGGRPRVVVATTVPATAHSLLRGQLRWMADQGLDIHLVSSPGDLLDQVGEREGVTTHAIPMRREISPVGDAIAMWRWVRMLRRLRPDVVSYGTPKAALLAGVAAALLRVPRRVYIMRGLRYERVPGPIGLILRFFEWLTCATAHTVVAVSPSLARTAVRARVVAERKIVVVGRGSSNGVDAELFRPPTGDERAAARTAAGVPQDCLVVGFVGRLTPDKGLACLERGFVELLRRVPTAHLVLVGEQERSDTSALRRLSARPQVHPVGFVADLIQRYAAFDVLCLPTRREGLPNVVLEAAACGIPAVSTRATGAVDAVLDGRTGLLVPVDDHVALGEALARLGQDPHLRARLGRRARQWVLAEFRPVRIWRGLLAAYRGDAHRRTYSAASGKASNSRRRIATRSRSRYSPSRKTASRS